MNKLTKAAIAGAAGIALLLGGAGSLAVWNQSATLGGSTITAGQLTITAESGATTTYTGTNDAVSLIVPGDSVTVTQPVTITASGDHLTATLSIDETGLLGGLQNYITTPIAVVAYDENSDPVDITGTLSVAQATSIKSIGVTVVFPASVDGLDGQNEVLQLGTLKVLLTQVAP